MFYDQLTQAVDNSPARANHLADLSHQVWRSWAGGSITDEQATGLAQAIAQKKAEGGSPKYPGGAENRCTAVSVARAAAPSLPKRRNQQSPDKAASIARRRRLASSGGLPPSIAEAFTIGEQAVMRVVTNEVKHKGICSLFIDTIAALSGTSRSTVQRAFRKAKDLGLLLVRERRRGGQKSLSNLISVISHKLREWVKLKDKARASLTCLKPDIRGASKLTHYALS